jgi:iron complex transport system substrate-binding protein
MTTGRKVELKEPAERIVTLAPFLTELVYSAGAGAKLVGCQRVQRLPARGARTAAGGQRRGSRGRGARGIEAGSRARLARQHPSRDVERIERLGIPIFVSQPRRLDEVAARARVGRRLAGVDATPRRPDTVRAS